MRFFTTQRALSRGIIFLLVLSFLLTPITPGLTAKRAEAATTVIEVGPVAVAAATTAAATGETAIATGALSLAYIKKEFTFDMLAWMALNLVLHQMSQSIVRWINSGFQGSPSFVTDFSRFMTDVADKVAGEYIWNSGLKALCEPFRLDVQIALDIQYRTSRNPLGETQCTLSKVLNNVDGAVASAKNWNDWFQISMRPENNTYGALLLAQENLSEKITGEKTKQEKMLDFGDGFFSRQKCEKVEGIEKCSVITPGSVIEEQLNNTLDSSNRRIQAADEINEIIAALFSQLVSRVFSGAGGLLGLTQSGYGAGSGSYYSDLAKSPNLGYIGTAPTSTGGGGGGGGGGTCGSMCTDSGVNRPALQIPIEQGWYDANAKVLKIITDAEAYRDTTCMASSSLPTNLQELKTQTENVLAISTTTIAKLTELSNRYIAATGSGGAAERTAVLQEYYQMTIAPYLLHNSQQIYQVSLYTAMGARTMADQWKIAINGSCGAGA